MYFCEADNTLAIQTACALLHNVPGISAAATIAGAGLKKIKIKELSLGTESLLIDNAVKEYI